MNKTIHSFLEESAEKFPNKFALIYGNLSKTYQELNNEANMIRNFFIPKTNKGDVVAILIDNSIDFVSVYFGILKSGCIALILPPNISDDNLIFTIKDSCPKFIIHAKKFSHKIKRLSLFQFVQIYVLEEKSFLSDLTYNRIVTSKDISSIIYTSGTTSDPKGVKLQHINVVSATINMNEFILNKHEDIFLSGLSLAHSFGLGNIHVTFMVGGTFILEYNFINIKKCLGDIIFYKATIFAATPATLKQITDTYPEYLIKCSTTLRMIKSNTGPIRDSLVLKILNLLPSTDFNYYYGLTEASRSTFINFKNEKNKIGSVGRPSPNTKIEIRSGEICIYGEHVIKEYWNNPLASKKIKEGWLYTGDTGYIDKEGYLFIEGRVDDIINVNGEKVVPQEIETIVSNIDGIEDVAVVGKPDLLLGEVVTLYVVTKKCTPNMITSILKKKLESYKLPKDIFIVQSIPKTDSGKIKRGELRKC